MLIKLYTYFGVVGIASVMLWLAGLVMLVNYFCHERRFVFYLRSAVLAALACLLAVINSCFVSRIEVDRSHELQVEFEQREKELNYLKDRAAKVKYAEDGKYDSMDLGGIESKESLSIYENAVRGREQSYLYKKDAAQKKPGRDEAGKPDLAAVIASYERTGLENSGARQLPLNDVVTANLWDKINRVAAASVLLLALLAMILDYLSRFNKTFGIFMPLPLSGRLLDHLFPKNHSVVLSSLPPESIRNYLRAAVQKGETFIYFGSTDPFSEHMSLAKLNLPLQYIWKEFIRLIRPFSMSRNIPCQNATNTLPISGRKLPRLTSFFITALLKFAGIIRWIFFMPISAIKKIFLFIGKLLRPLQKPLRAFLCFLNALFNSFLQHHFGLKSFIEKIKCGMIELFPVQKLAYSSGMPPFSNMFVCESAWFGRYCFVFKGAEIAHPILESIRRFLEFRIKPHATAGQTVNIVWDLGTRIPEQIAREIACLSRETNFRFVLMADQALPLEYKNIFDEAFPDHGPAEPKISIFARFLNRCRPIAVPIQLYILNFRHKIQKKRAAKAEMKKSQVPAIPDKAVIEEQSIAIKPAAASSVHMEPEDIDIGNIKPVLPEKSDTAKTGQNTSPPAFATTIKEAQPDSIITIVKEEKPGQIQVQPGQLAPGSVAKNETMEPARPSLSGSAPPRLVIKTPKVSETVEKGQPGIAVPKVHVSRPIIKVSQKAPVPLHPEGLPPVLKKPVVPNREAANIHTPSLKTEAQKKVPFVKPAPDLKAHEIPPAVPGPRPKPKVTLAHQPIEQKQTEKESKISVADVDQAGRVFKFFCPTCNQKLSAEFEWHGRSAICPHCKTKIVIPKVF